MFIGPSVVFTNVKEPRANIEQKNNFLKTQITQIYINDKSEFELIPLLGDQIILFGDISRLDEKLMYLETFYRQETKNLGWTQYKTINLKFKNQVVCTKK